jgi:predicted RecB family nuclease
MKWESDRLRLSASDLSGYLNCRHLTELERSVATGALERPKAWDPLLEVLWQRGLKHEGDYVAHLAHSGLQPVRIEGVGVDDDAVEATLEAMRAGALAIVQGALRDGRWTGRADVLLRVERPSDFGPWSYEAVDTKLSRQTKGGTILQLSLYSDLLGAAQGPVPEHMHVVQPWTEFEPQTFRIADFAAYYRRIRAGLEASLDGEAHATYPDPVAHCDICTWRRTCEHRRREDDHLSLVAGISKSQIDELGEHGIASVAALAEMPLPLLWKPQRGSAAALARVREQARLQVRTRETGLLTYEPIPCAQGFGLSQLPEPSPGDIFLDFEGDPFVGESGLEYLLGYHFADENGEPVYRPLWALDRAQEKAAFETFIDFATARCEAFPDLHIYHYGAYERSALTRLMGRYATREDELDRLLRGKKLVDLLTVVRQAIRAGVESYSIKKLEPLYGFERDASLPDANLALSRVQTSLELDDPSGLAPEDQATVEIYNRDDCVSTRCLRDWLEEKRSESIAQGAAIPRPEPGEPAPSETVAEWLALIGPLVEALSADVPADEAERTPEQHARWLLAQMLEWHRREDKAVWWELFRLSELPAEDLIDEKAGLAGLQFVGTVGGTALCPVHRYAFPLQEADVRPGKDLRSTGGAKFGCVEDFDQESRTVDIKKRKDTAGFHPEAVFVHEYVDPEPMQLSLVRLARHVAGHGMTGSGPYAAARDLLLRERPRLEGEAPLRLEDEPSVDAGRRIAPLLTSGVLPIQGPPGTGKTFTGAHMVCELARRNLRVGIVANSHAVIRNFLDAVVEVAEETGTDLRCVHKPKAREPDLPRLRCATRPADLLAALRGDCQVAGATAWLWSTPEAFESVDVLFVDEAAQLSLANVLAVSQAARAVVLVGDPQQLDQPMQGSHPEGTGCSALHHLLGGAKTIAADQGLFLEETWRLHPAICAFTSEVFYESRLEPRLDLANQILATGAPVAAAGLTFVPVAHEGCTNASREEAAATEALVQSILEPGARWTDRHGEIRDLRLEDILIIAPYNAQVLEIQKRLPGARVGTVDKFQGQEAPIAIYSVTTSSQADAPRGMEFLYSLNRLNVATSRARCVSVMLASPRVFEAECRTPRQMQLANAFCRFLELAGN